MAGAAHSASKACNVQGAGMGHDGYVFVAVAASTL